MLFGAGASYGCGDAAPENPPLGTQLFDELVRCYSASWGQLPAEVADTFSLQGFEKGMALLYKSYDVLGLMSHMGLYFSQFRPSTRGSTAYGKLAQQIRDRGLSSGLVLSMLNYDCILELELGNTGLEFDYGFGKPELGRVSVLKPHGSCNFSWSASVGHQGL